jgi:GMP synthase-like glutamine amidotransferase
MVLYPPRIVLEKSVGPSASDQKQELRLAFLGCENKPHYGPYEHTAALFLDLITRALVACCTEDEAWNVSISVYKAKEGDFPKTRDEWDTFDGIILPGSFNAAYDNEEWIHALSRVIQDELVAKSRPTLGVCFGHQLYAHSYDSGGAIKCGAGLQVGRRRSSTTEAGRLLLGGQETFDLFYTHGDMVDRLPKEAVCLGGDDRVPIQSVAYFKTAEEATTFQNASNNGEIPKPIAITFQAHPEYASPELGFDRTLSKSLDDMEDRGALSAEDRRLTWQDAKENYTEVERQSINLMISAGRQLGWFPSTRITST